MQVATFAEVEAVFLERVHTVVWCNMATLDAQHRVRSRAVRPIWQDGVGWIASNNTLKVKHIAEHPYGSLAYVADHTEPIYVDCRMEWDVTTQAKAYVWKLFQTAPPPLGYEPSPFFGSVDRPNFGVIRCVPWRIEVQLAHGESLIWLKPDA